MAIVFSIGVETPWPSNSLQISLGSENSSYAAVMSVEYSARMTFGSKSGRYRQPRDAPPARVVILVGLDDGGHTKIQIFWRPKKV